MKKQLLSFLLVLVTFGVSAQSIIVNDPNDPETALSAEDLIRDVLVDGSGCVDINLTNLAEDPAGTNNPALRSWGYFTNGGTSFPFEEGIILSSGIAVEAQGPNDAGGNGNGSGNPPWLGDIDIETLLDNFTGTNIATNNATVFEFTFTSAITDINFEYIFASEEYENDFECTDTFRDGFAFLISGPGIPDDSGAPFGGTNIASVPGSANVPVSTLSIHDDSFTCGTEILGVDFFPELYVSNQGGNNTNEIQFDGRTVVLNTATVTVIPGEVYTAKLVIADRGDTGFDSAVFLNAGSFNVGNIELGDDILVSSGNAVCDGETITLDATTDDATSYAWFFDGVILVTETNPTLDVTIAGTYTVEVEIDLGNGQFCVLSDEIIVEFAPLPIVDIPDLNSCFIDPDTEVLDATPSNVDPALATYQWFLDGVEIIGETSQILIINEPGTYTVTVTSEAGCITTEDVIVTLANPDGTPCDFTPNCFFLDFVEDFGTGTGRITTPFTNLIFNGTGQINDGEYAITNISDGLNTGWHQGMEDNTPDDIDGRALFVNATFAPAEFYRRSINILEDSDYTFAAFITTVYDTDTNICPDTGIPSNVIFRIEDTAGNTIAEITTGDIQNEADPNWQQFSIDFNSASNTTIELVLINNALGGCGNDLAIDDLSLGINSTPPPIITPDDIEACDELEDGVEIFDLTTQIPSILNGLDPSEFEISFHTTLIDAESSFNAIDTPDAYINVGSPETIYVRVEIAGQPLCFSIVSFDLVLFNIIDLTTNLPASVELCTSTPISALDATPTNPEIDLSLVTYTWVDQDGNVVSTDPTFTPTVPGTLTITIDAPPCSQAVFTVEILMNPPVVDLGDDALICDGDIFEIVPTFTGDVDGASFLWSTGETTPTIFVDEAGTFELTITVGSCTASDDIVITVATPPIVDLGPDELVCDGESFEIIPILSGDLDGATFLWSTGETTDTIIVDQTGTFTLTVTVGPCTVSDDIVVTVADPVIVTIRDDFTTCREFAETFVATTDTPGATFEWFIEGVSQGETSATFTTSFPLGTPSGQEVTVVVTNADGCTGEATSVVSFFEIDQCVIPEGISPGTTIGFNDRLDLEFLALRTGIETIHIYNRLGTLVFEQDNYVNQWEGQSDDGDTLPTATYFYVIDFDGNDPIYGNQATGWIYVNREN